MSRTIIRDFFIVFAGVYAVLYAKERGYLP